MAPETSSILRTSVRFGTDTIISTSATPSTNTSPTAVALATLSTATESLPSTAHKHVYEFGEKIINSFAKVLRHRSIVAKFADKEHVPRSVRLSFQLNASKSVAETQEYRAAAKATADLVSKFQREATAQVKVVADLEQQALEKALAHLILRTICIWSKLSLLLNGQLSPTATELYPYYRVAVILPNLKKYLLHLNEADVNSVFVEVIGTINANDAFVPTDAHQAFATQIDKIIVGSLTAFETTNTQNATLLAARAFVDSTTTESMTASVAMELDNEPTINKETIDALIASAVQKELKKARNLASSNNSNNRQKNVKRGAPSASLKNKTEMESTTSPQRSKKANKPTAPHTTIGRGRSQTPNRRNRNRSTHSPDDETGLAANDNATASASKRNRNDNSRRPSRKKSRSRSGGRRTRN